MRRVCPTARLALLAAVCSASVAACAPDASQASTANPEEAPQSRPAATQTTPAPPAPAPPPKPTVRTRLASLPRGKVSNGTAPLVVRLSGPVAPGSPAPLLRPGVAGTWKAAGDAEYFFPKSTLQPCSDYRLTIWAGSTAAGDLPLGKRRTVTLHVACPSLRGLQQALARLGYLPYVLHSAHGENARARRESRAEAAHYAYRPDHGAFLPYSTRVPRLRYGSLDTTTRGALMVYQSGHGLSPTGTPDKATWASLLAAETLARRDPRPYTWVTVSERIPEKLEVHVGRRVVLTTPVNTGVPGAVTQQGVFPIYARYTSTTMSGTNPDGSHYSDPGVPWVNYFNGGDAVHGFPRPSYGTPQSNGCVELPIATAARVYRMLSIGDLVIVS